MNTKNNQKGFALSMPKGFTLPRNVNAEGGFTLIELLIVIGIISILAAAVIITITPGERLEDARNATRDSHFSAIGTGLHMMVVEGDADDMEYAVDSCTEEDEDVLTPEEPGCELSENLEDPDGTSNYEISEEDGRVQVCTDSDESDYECGEDFMTF